MKFKIANVHQTNNKKQPQEVLYKKLSLKVCQYSQGNTCPGVSIYSSWKPSVLEGIPEKWDPGPGTQDPGPIHGTLHLGPSTWDPGPLREIRDLGSFTWNPGPKTLNVGTLIYRNQSIGLLVWFLNDGDLRHERVN